MKKKIKRLFVKFLWWAFNKLTKEHGNKLVEKLNWYERKFGGVDSN